jgi:PAS domain S-box-containing protein
MDTDFAETLIANMPDAVVYSDRDGTIRYWNGGAVRLFGHVAGEAVGQSLDLIIPEGLRARHWEGYHETMRTGRTRYGNGQLLSVPAMRKDGSRISVAFTIVPFVDDQGALIGSRRSFAMSPRNSRRRALYGRKSRHYGNAVNRSVNGNLVLRASRSGLVTVSMSPSRR